MGILQTILGRGRSGDRTATGGRTPALIHIPKTGGTYIRQLETASTPVIQPLRDLGHVCVTDSRRSGPVIYPPQGFTDQLLIARKDISRNLVTAVVRNPFSWFVSYAAHAGGWSPKYVDPSHYDYRNVERGFDYLLRTIADREAPWPSRRLLFFQLFSDAGEFVCDWVCRNETLDADLAKLASSVGAQYTQGPRQRVGKHDDYRTYYTPELIRLVETTWGRELALYGYDFDGVRDGAGSLVGPIEPAQREAVRYDWAADVLAVSGEVVTARVAEADP